MQEMLRDGHLLQKTLARMKINREQRILKGAVVGTGVIVSACSCGSLSPRLLAIVASQEVKHAVGPEG